MKYLLFGGTVDGSYISQIKEVVPIIIKKPSTHPSGPCFLQIMIRTRWVKVWLVSRNILGNRSVTCLVRKLYIQGGKANLANESQHMTGDVTLGEAGRGIGEQVLPFPHEDIKIIVIPKTRVIFRDYLLCQVGFQSPPPLAESARIICYRMLRCAPDKIGTYVRAEWFSTLSSVKRP
jgi:hypothetical protein